VKRLILIASLVLGLGFVAAPVATPAAPSDAQGPACGNIVGADGGSYVSGVVDVTVFLAAPTCSFVTYTLTVTDANGNTITPVSSTSKTDSSPNPCTPDTPGEGCVEYVETLPSGSPTVVCLSAATYIHGHLVDLAPNTSPSTYCLVEDVSPAGGNFN
jgi:hypothetical protein